MKLLMIGNSFCYYFVKELHGIPERVVLETLMFRSMNLTERKWKYYSRLHTRQWRRLMEK